MAEVMPSHFEGMRKGRCKSARCKRSETPNLRGRQKFRWTRQFRSPPARCPAKSLHAAWSENVGKERENFPSPLSWLITCLYWRVVKQKRIRKEYLCMQLDEGCL